jgi:PucR C-terminal helix-turn-helix domain
MRQAEIEEAIVTRALAVQAPTGREDPAYLDGLRGAVSAAVAYGCTAIEFGEHRTGPTPLPIPVQARQAARNQVDLAVVLRRYAAGYSTLIDCLEQEVCRLTSDGDGPVFSQLQRELTALFDRLVTEVSREYEGESGRIARAPRQSELLMRLLAGEPVESSEVPYPLGHWHVGLFGQRLDPALLKGVSVDFDCRVISVEFGEGRTAAWLGARAPLEVDDLATALMSKGQGAPLGIGEPALGLTGWRLTHRQARTAHSTMAQGVAAICRYGDIAVGTAAARDKDLEAFLLGAFLSPLEAERDGGAVLKGTLRAYFAAGRSSSSAAASLSVTRHTVTNRLRTVEERLGRSIDRWGVELEIALRLEKAGFGEQG